MLFKLAKILLILSVAAAQDLNFVYNGFDSGANIWQYGPTGGVSVDGTVNKKRTSSYTFYANPVIFKNDSSSNSSVFSFSTTFVFAIGGQNKGGLAFVISPTRGLPGALPSQYLGLFNSSNNGDSSNHVFAVELDTMQSTEFEDINDNHVGIDINGLNSAKSAAAGYYTKNNGGFRNLTLISGKEMKVWVEYDSTQKQINVTMAPFNVGKKPETPLLSLKYDLTPVLKETMYIGFSASTGSVATLSTFQYVLGWSFRMNGQAQELDASKLPKLPVDKKVSKLLSFGVPVMLSSLVLLAISLVVCVIRRKKYAELLEDWELEYGPQRFKYKELYQATNGFGEKEVLGVGGFGKVYRGKLPNSRSEVAVKRVSHKSRQGMKEFIAEIVSLGRLRHRNLVQLLGYCRRNDELLLVYDYMPNGSLDRYLYNQPKVTLKWSERFRVIKGVASGLFYLHEEWEQVVIHRDVKASNVLLDEDLNGRLGDFGLARLCDHGADPQTTHVAGTIGYLAPEHARTGRATTSTDVFSFGAFLLEVACGKRPIDTHGTEEDIDLVDRVLSCWNRRNILEARDENLGTDFVPEEIELVLKLGLLCCSSHPRARPSMRQVVQYLEGDIPLSELHLSSGGLGLAHDEDFQHFLDVAVSNKSLYVPESEILSGGR